MKNNIRGAASILVVLIVLVFTAFGGALLTAGWINKKLAVKTAQSKIDFYLLDTAAEEIVAQADEKLFLSMQNTTIFMNSIILIKEDIKDSQDPKLAALLSIGSSEAKSKAVRVILLDNTFSRIYFYNSAKALSLYAKKYNMTLVYGDDYECADDFLNPDNNVPSNGDLKLSYIVSAGDSPGLKNLEIIIAVMNIKNSIKILNDEAWQSEFTIEKQKDVQRFKILSWKQNQNPIDYEIKPQNFS